MGNGKTLTADIIAVLEAERAALRAGDADSLQQIADKKAELVARLEHTRPSQAAVSRLRTEAARNEALLGGHAAGIRAAMRRLQALAQANAPIASYNGDGARAQIGPSHPDFEHRS